MDTRKYTGNHALGQIPPDAMPDLKDIPTIDPMDTDEFAREYVRKALNDEELPVIEDFGRLRRWGSALAYVEHYARYGGSRALRAEWPCLREMFPDLSELEPPGWTLPDESNTSPVNGANETAKFVSVSNEVVPGGNESSKWQPKSASELSGEIDVCWLWEGFLAIGLVTDMYGLWKSGKTTLIAALIRAMAEGGELAGRPVKKGRVLVVAEESEATWKRRATKMGIAEHHVRYINRPFKARASGGEWRKFLEHVQQLAGEYDLIIFDALPNLWPVVQENDASEVIGALIPLQALTEKSAVLVLRHPRKGDGTEATAGRGSGAISGFVDIIVEFRRYHPEEKNGTRRVLSVYSREDPFECVVEWDGEAGYRCIGEKADASQEDRIAVLVRIITEHTEPTIEEMLASWPNGTIPTPGRTTVQGDLDRASARALVIRTGDGVKGSPYRWSRVDTSATNPNADH